MAAIKHLFSIIVSLFTGLFVISLYANDLNALLHSGDPIGGNPHGKITVVEFFDYQCSHCVNMAPTLQAIIKANPDVRIIYKELPIRGELSMLASRAALAVNRQGKYAAFNHAIMQDNNFSAASLTELAKQLKLNMAQFKKDMESDRILSKLNANRDLAEALQVTGTPAFFIGKTNAANLNDMQFVLGEMSQAQLQAAIDAARK
jgi:protein-disulfide isomerase